MSNIERERDEAILERDEMRRANITPEDAARPLGQSVEYWQDRALDHATHLDRARIQLREAVEDRDRYRAALIDAGRALNRLGRLDESQAALDLLRGGR